VKAKIRLNTKRLYAADGKAVKELLKIATVLYDALRANSQVAAEDPDAEAAPMPSQLKNIKVPPSLAPICPHSSHGAQGARLLATEITENGARLFDLLGKERDVRQERSKVSASSGVQLCAHEHHPGSAGPALPGRDLWKLGEHVGARLR
jgi:clusterin-associated protein 1